MKFGFVFALAASLAAITISPPALAQKNQPQAAAEPQKEVLWDWWFVWAGGESPSREVIYIDSLSVREEVDHAAIMNAPLGKKMKKWPIAYVQADGVSIYEDPKKPARINGRVLVKCEAQQMKFEASYQTYWDTDRGLVTGPASPWLDANSDLRYSQIAKFLCEPGARNDKNMMMRADQTSDPLDTTWDILWKDAKKPEFTTKKSREEIDAEYEATLAKTQKLIGGAIADAEKRLDGMNQEEAFMISIRNNFQSKDKKFHSLFYSMPGWSEETINTVWGPPRRSGWDGETRVLIYPYQDTVYDQVQTPVDVMSCQGGGCAKVGETTQTSSVARTVNCERTLYLRPGGSKPGPRLFDYAWNCF